MSEEVNKLRLALGSEGFSVGYVNIYEGDEDAYIGRVSSEDVGEKRAAEIADLIVAAVNAHDELVKACAAMEWLVPLVLDADKMDVDDWIDPRCPECHTQWSLREIRAMVQHGVGACMCRRWNFDVAAALALATSDAKGASK